MALPKCCRAIRPTSTNPHFKDVRLLVWESDSRCNTLNVHADRKTGTYCPWPSNDTEGSLEGLDLNTDEAWLFLKNDITRPERH